MNRARRAVPLLLGLALLCATRPVQGADPACKQQCDELVQKGELDKSVSHEGCYVRVCQREARRLYADAQYQEAFANLDFVYDKLQDSPSFLMDLGLTFYALDRFEDALAAFDRLLKGFPLNVRAGAQRGHTLVRLKQYDQAIAQFQKLEASPKSEGEYNGLDTRSYLRGNLAVAKILKGEVPAGKKNLIEAVKMDARNKLAASYLSNVLPYLEIGALEVEGARVLVAAYEDLGLKKLAAAAEGFKTVLVKNPRYAPAYQTLAEILRSYQQYAACEEALKIGEQALPKDVTLRAERLRCTLLRVGANSDAAKPSVSELLALRKAHPDNPRIKQILIAVGYPP